MSGKKCTFFFMLEELLCHLFEAFLGNSKMNSLLSSASIALFPPLRDKRRAHIISSCKKYFTILNSAGFPPRSEFLQNGGHVIIIFLAQHLFHIRHSRL